MTIRRIPNGFVLIQTNPDLAANMQNGWLYYLHPDGQWVTKRKLTDLELMQVEDQKFYNVVL